MRNFKLLALFCDCTGRFVSDLVGNHIVGFPTRRLICFKGPFCLFYFGEIKLNCEWCWFILFTKPIHCIQPISFIFMFVYTFFKIISTIKVCGSLVVLFQFLNQLGSILTLGTILSKTLPEVVAPSQHD